MNGTVEVVAALIREGDRYLICRRPADKARGLLWEFAGGKTERGETGKQAIVRECMEELDVTVEPHGVFTEVTHDYEDITVHLTLYNCTVARGVPKLKEHSDMKWVTAEEMQRYEFCPADADIIEKIKREG